MRRGPLSLRRGDSEGKRVGARFIARGEHGKLVGRKNRAGIVDGDRITGLNLPQTGVRYYYNGKLLGEIRDREFAKAFFGIWLDPRTSEPALRKQLLGEAE